MSIDVKLKKITRNRDHGYNQIIYYSIKSKGEFDRSKIWRITYGK